MTVGFFDMTDLVYRPIAIDEQVEVVSLSGSIARKDDEPAVHAHVVIADSSGAARGGHLIEAIVRPTLEVFVTTTPSKLERRMDPATRLPLIRL